MAGTLALIVNWTMWLLVVNTTDQGHMHKTFKSYLYFHISPFNFNEAQFAAEKHVYGILHQSNTKGAEQTQIELVNGEKLNTHVRSKMF